MEGGKREGKGRQEGGWREPGRRLARQGGSGREEGGSSSAVRRANPSAFHDATRAATRTTLTTKERPTIRAASAKISNGG